MDEIVRSTLTVMSLQPASAPSLAGSYFPDPASAVHSSRLAWPLPWPFYASPSLRSSAVASGYSLHTVLVSCVPLPFVFLQILPLSQMVAAFSVLTLLSVHVQTRQDPRVVLAHLAWLAWQDVAPDLLLAPRGSLFHFRHRVFRRHCSKKTLELKLPLRAA